MGSCLASCLEYNSRVQHQSADARLLSGSARARSCGILAHRSHAHGVVVSSWATKESRLCSIRHFSGIWFFWWHCHGRDCRSIQALGLLLLDRRHPDGNYADNYGLVRSASSFKGPTPKQSQNGLPWRHHDRLWPRPSRVFHLAISTRPCRLANAIYSSLSHTWCLVTPCCRLHRNASLCSASLTSFDLHDSLHEPSSFGPLPALRHLGHLFCIWHTLFPEYHVC